MIGVIHPNGSTHKELTTVTNLLTNPHFWGCERVIGYGTGNIMKGKYIADEWTVANCSSDFSFNSNDYRSRLDRGIECIAGNAVLRQIIRRGFFWSTTDPYTAYAKCTDGSIITDCEVVKNYNNCYIDIPISAGQKIDFAAFFIGEYSPDAVRFSNDLNFYECCTDCQRFYINRESVTAFKLPGKPNVLLYSEDFGTSLEADNFVIDSITKSDYTPVTGMTLSMTYGMFSSHLRGFEFNENLPDDESVYHISFHTEFSS